MNYPIEILPNNSRKLISCDVRSHFLIRSIPSSVGSDLIDEATGEIRQNVVCSPREHIIDLSTSLLGVFTIDHSKIELIGERKAHFSNYCDPDFNAETLIYQRDFFFDESKGFWTILIEYISEEPVTYTLGDRPNATFTAECRVVHSPAMWNFWHFSVKWYLTDYKQYLDEIVDDSLKKRITKRLSGLARALIAKYGKIIEPNYHEILKDCYLKGYSEDLNLPASAGSYTDFSQE